MPTQAQLNPFPFSDSNKRYQTYHYALTNRFGQKVSRVSLNAGFSCPNLDGKKGWGGCTYCSSQGSGEFAGESNKPIHEQFDEVASRMSAKWDTPLHIAYLQAHTNTYAPLDVLRRVYEQALACPGVVGLAIATRADCLSEQVCDLLCEFHEKTYLVVELGLQTVHERTAEKINRCCTYDEFLKGYSRLQARGVHTGIHLINGLPGETADDMVISAIEVGKLHPHFLKLHMLYLVQNTEMAKQYFENRFHILTLEEYVNIVCDQLERIPAECVIGRLTGDGDASNLIEPQWSRRKFVVLNAIDKEFQCRNSWQGKRYKK